MGAANTLILAGRLTRDPESKTTTSGKRLVNFSIAVNEGKDKVMFVNCTAWDKTADIIATHALKGMMVLVKGSLQIQKSEYEGATREFTKCNVNEFQIMDWGKNKQDGASAPKKQGYTSKSVDTELDELTPDDLGVDEFDAADMPF